MDKTHLTQPRRAPEDDSDVDLATITTDSELLEDVEYTRMRRLSTEFAQVGGVRDF